MYSSQTSLENSEIDSSSRSTSSLNLLGLALKRFGKFFFFVFKLINMKNILVVFIKQINVLVELFHSVQNQIKI